MTKPTVESLIAHCDEVIAQSTCVTSALIVATELRERLVGEQQVDIVGYAVWKESIKEGAALYNCEQRAEAFSAFRRWPGVSISALAIHPNAPEPSDGKE